MAPMKFEDKLKERLEERQLQPSADAWSKLNEQLDAHETRGNKKAYWWLGIAASLVGVLMLVTFLNKDVTKTPIEPVIVDTDEIDVPVIKNENSSQIAEEKIPEDTNSNDGPKQKEAKQTTNQPTLKKKIQVEQHKLVPKKIDEAVAEAVKQESQEERLKQPLSFEEQKAKEVVAQIRALQEQKETVTEAEIDALLNVAQKEIELKQLYNAATNKVDANALLQSVEDDLERSFRTRVFEMLQSGYKELKTAVAERNN